MANGDNTHIIFVVSHSAIGQIITTIFRLHSSIVALKPAQSHSLFSFTRPTLLFALLSSSFSPKWILADATIFLDAGTIYFNV